MYYQYLSVTSSYANPNKKWVYVYITLNSGYITFQRKCFVANEYNTQNANKFFFSL